MGLAVLLTTEWPSETGQAWRIRPSAWLLIGGYEAPLFLIGLTMAARTLLRWIGAPLDPGHAFQSFLAVWGTLGTLLYFFGGQPELPRLFFAMAPLTALTGISLAERLLSLSRQTLWDTLPNALPAGVALVYALLSVSEVAGGGAADPGIKMLTAAASLVVAALFLGIGVAQAARPRAALAFLAACVSLVFVVHGSSRVLADPWMATSRLSSHGLAAALGPVRLARYTPAGKSLQVAVAQDLKPAVAWYLRTTPGVAYMTQPLPGPDLVLNREGAPLAEASRYAGRSLPLLETWDPEPMDWRDALRWFLNGDRRPEHIQSQRMVVWTKVL